VSALYEKLAIRVQGHRWALRASAAFVIGTLVLASPARADHTSVHATVDGEVATTDNLFAAGSADRQAEMFFTVRPGVLFAYDAPQMIHDFTAEAEVSGYLLHNDKPLITGRGGWKGLFLPGPRSQVTMTINAATGILSLLSTRTSPEDTTATVVPAGNVDVQQADSAVSTAWISSEHTRVLQGVLGRYGFTDDGSGTRTETREVGGNLGFERTFRKDTVALDASVSYLRLERIALPGAVLGSKLDHQINPRATVQWRHDIDRQWSVNADGGLVFVNPVGVDKYNPDMVRHGGTFALFGAQAAYVQPWGRAVLSARRDVAPNLFLAQNTVNDSANLQLALPLPWLTETRRVPKLAALGSVGVARTQLINSDSGATEGDFKVAHLDVSVAYTPTPGQTYGVRYELMYQTGDTVAVMAIPAYLRNTLFATFSLRFPERVAGEVPKRARITRSDRKDLLPGGVDIVPDVLEPARDDDGGGSRD
jgi:hypothetical protein